MGPYCNLFSKAIVCFEMCHHLDGNDLVTEQGETSLKVIGSFGGLGISLWTDTHCIAEAQTTGLSGVFSLLSILQRVLSSPCRT